MALPKISIKKGREWQLLRGHPWLFSGAISQAPGKTEPGSLVDLVDLNGKFVARGYYNPNCDIAVRVLTRDSQQEIDEAFLESRIRSAVALRRQLIDQDATDVFRLINSEGDYLPGFIVDSFAGSLVVQSHTAGSDKLLSVFVSALQTVTNAETILLRNDAPVRKREGLEIEQPGFLAGQLDRELTVKEHNLNYFVDLLHGQKTGFFSDQRDKRLALTRYAKLFPPKARVANCFCYSSGFSISMLATNNAIYTANVDESQRALDLAARNFALNGIVTDKHSFVCADAFKWLENQHEQGNTFDLVILDPPAFAKTHKEKNNALKGYIRLNELGIQCVAPGALLMTCSCTGSITLDEFCSTIHDAAARTGRDIQVLEVFQHGGDHPVIVSALETGYLKVLICRVL